MKALIWSKCVSRDWWYRRPSRAWATSSTSTTSRRRVVGARQHDRGVERRERDARVAVARRGDGLERLVGDVRSSQLEAAAHEHLEVLAPTAGTAATASSDSSARRSPRSTGSRSWRRSGPLDRSRSRASKRSCWDLLKRWTSSMNSTVRCAGSPSRSCARADRFAHVLHAARDGRQALGRVARGVREDPRQRRLAGAGRTPEDHRGELAGLDESSQRAVRADEVRPGRRVRRACAVAGAQRAARPASGAGPRRRRRAT